MTDFAYILRRLNDAHQYEMVLPQRELDEARHCCVELHRLGMSHLVPLILDRVELIEAWARGPVCQTCGRARPTKHHLCYDQPEELLK